MEIVAVVVEGYSYQKVKTAYQGITVLVVSLKDLRQMWFTHHLLAIVHL